MRPIRRESASSRMIRWVFLLCCPRLTLHCLSVIISRVFFALVKSTCKMPSYSWELQWQRHITNCAQQITTVDRKGRFSTVMRESTKIDCSRDKTFSLIISGVLSYVTIPHASSDIEQPLWIPCYFASEVECRHPFVSLAYSCAIHK